MTGNAAYQQLRLSLTEFQFFAGAQTPLASRGWVGVAADFCAFGSMRPPPQPIPCLHNRPDQRSRHQCTNTIQPRVFN
jgi:hypothetical protein